MVTDPIEVGVREWESVESVPFPPTTRRAGPRDYLGRFVVHGPRTGTRFKLRVTFTLWFEAEPSSVQVPSTTTVTATSITT